jgi:hypothetical protein
MARKSEELDLSTANLKSKPYQVDKNLRKIKNPLAYEVRLLQMYLRRVNRGLSLNPLFVDAKDYVYLLEVHTQKVAKLKKEGWPRGEDSKDGNDEGEVESEVHESTAEGTRKAGLPRVDSDIYS